MTFVCPKQTLKAVIRIGDNTEKEGGFMGFGATQRSDVIKGAIYQYDPCYVHKKCQDYKEQAIYDWKMHDKVKDIAIISGSWFENLVIAD